MQAERTPQVIDCHYHYEQEVVSVEGLIRSMDAAGVHRMALIAPMNEMIPAPGPLAAELMCMCLRWAPLRVIPRFLLTSFSVDGTVRLPGGTYRIYSDPDNDTVFSVVERYPDRFLGWVFVNPRGQRDQFALLERWLDSSSCVGVKAHPFWHRYPPVELLPFGEMLVKVQKPLLMHLGFGEHAAFRRLLRALPELKLVLAHAGFPYYDSIWKRIRALPNVYVDLSQLSYVNGRMTRDVVSYLGVERCLFGTDGPTGALGGRYGHIKRRIESLFADHGVRRRLLGENFAELVGLQ